MPLFSRVSRYVKRGSKLSFNAKLFLVVTSLRGLSGGIWQVIFYLYLNLNEVGFQPDFIGNMFTISTIATGLMALPAGLCYEYLGAKRALLVGLTANLISFIQIVALHPYLLLVTSLTSSLIGTIGWVVSAPFMMQNSTREERTFLFSMNWTLMIAMNVTGSLIGGILPNAFNNLFNLPTGSQGSAFGFRISLVMSLLIYLVAALPILKMSQMKSRRQSTRATELLRLRNIQSHRTILKLMTPAAIIGFGAGFIVPLSSLFFKLKFLATTEQIGMISAIRSITLGLGTLAAPAISEKIGKVKSVFLCQIISTPFVMLITLSPNLFSASTAYITRAALMNMAGPINSAFRMEMVKEEERGTANGLLIMADSIPRAMTTSLTGSLMVLDDFFSPFLITTFSYIVASSLYFTFFRRSEHSQQMLHPTET